MPLRKHPSMLASECTKTRHKDTRTNTHIPNLCERMILVQCHGGHRSNFRGAVWCSCLHPRAAWSWCPGTRAWRCCKTRGRRLSGSWTHSEIATDDRGDWPLLSEWRSGWISIWVCDVSMWPCVSVGVSRSFDWGRCRPESPGRKDLYAKVYIQQYDKRYFTHLRTSHWFLGGSPFQLCTQMRRRTRGQHLYHFLWSLLRGRRPAVCPRLQTRELCDFQIQSAHIRLCGRMSSTHVMVHRLFHVLGAGGKNRWMGCSSRTHVRPVHLRSDQRRF